MKYKGILCEGEKIRIHLQLTCVAYQVWCQADCTAAGRYAVAGTDCKNYTLCVYVATNASYISYEYVCPTTSVFNPNTQLCTSPASYNCTDTT